MDIKLVQSRMQKTFDNFRGELAKLRTGRANSALVETVSVDYYGSSTPLKNVATISVPDARSLTIQPWDVSQIPVIEKAIMTSDLGLTPNNDGKVIRIQLPPLSEERRKDLVKLAKKISEDSKVAIRMVRKDCIDETKKEELPEDTERRIQNDIQKVTDEFTKKIDSLLETKEKDILNV